jgi:hypothetical protein
VRISEGYSRGYDKTSRGGWFSWAALAALSLGAAQAQTFYWNPPAGGDALKASNWSANPNGSGLRPQSGSDDDFTADALAGAWTVRTMSATVTAGSASTTATQDQLTLTGNGNDINTLDNGYVTVYRHDLGRNVDVTIKLASRTCADINSKAGLVVADDLGDLTKGGYAMVQDLVGDGASFAYDADGNGFIDNETAGTGVATAGAKYLRLVKNGKTFTGYYKMNAGDAWISLGSVFLASADTTSTHVGIFSNGSGATCNTVFDDFSGGGDIAVSNLDLRFNGTGTGHNANAALSGSLAAAAIDFTGYTGTFSFGSSALTLTGASAVFTSQMGLSAGTGSLVFSGSGTQTLTPKPGSALPAVVHSGAGTLKLAGALSSASFLNSSGVLDFNGFDLSTTGNLQVTGGGPATLANLGGRTLTVGGTAALAGSSGNLLGLDPSSAWSIHATGALSADFARIKNSSATGSAGSVTADCVNGGSNSNWNFPAVNAPAAVTRQPKDTAADTGKAASFTVAASGTAPIAYHWKRAGSDTATLSTDTIFTVAHAGLADNGALFYCIVSNAFGRDSTRQAKLTVTAPHAPSITSQPLDTSVVTGHAATFSVAVSGSAPLAYQWKRVGGNAVLSTASFYTIAAPAAGDNGAQFYCLVSNAYGKDSSAAATLTVIPVCDTAFTVSADTTVDEGAQATLTGKADCASSYEWSLESGPSLFIPDPLSPTLKFKAPRITGDTVIVFRFTVYFGDSPAVKRVKVTVKEAVPDPQITFPSALSWDGSKPMTLKPALSNGAELAKFPFWALRYAWTLSSPTMADTALAGDSLVLSNARQDGLLEVRVCVDNGGAPACGKAGVTIGPGSTSVAALRGAGGAVELAGRILLWRAHARVIAHDWNGRRIWEAEGNAGETLALPQGLARDLDRGRVRLQFVR